MKKKRNKTKLSNELTLTTTGHKKSDEKTLLRRELDNGFMVAEISSARPGKTPDSSW